MQILEGQPDRTAAYLRLKIGDFTYPDLYKTSRLKDLLDVFDSELVLGDPELFARWDSYRQSPNAARTPVEVSALLVSVAERLGRFIARLFDIETEAEALAFATADQDPVFRFTFGFVRRRVRPHLKKFDAPDSVQLETCVQRLREAARCADSTDLELATAMAATKL